MEQRTELIPVRLAKDIIIHVEAVCLDKEEDVAFGVADFIGVTHALEAIAATITPSLQKMKPNKASVEFGLELGIESGKLTALLVKGTGKANLKITLEW